MNESIELALKNKDETASYIASLHTQLKEKDELLSEKNSLITSLQHRLELALRYRFSPRSEKPGDKPQKDFFFDEALVSPEEACEITQVDAAITNVCKTTLAKKPGRRPLPLELPRIQHIHDVPEDAKTCGCGHALTCIGQEHSEQLDYIPAKVQVIEHIRLKYACKRCEEGVKTAVLPPQPIAKSIATPGLLAHILTSKFCDHIPFYRQENILQRHGIDIARATLCNWALACGTLVEPLVALLHKQIIRYDIAYADETVVQVLNEKDRAPTTNSYMWLLGGGPPDKRCWIYRYDPTRSSEVPLTFFEAYQGYLHIDGYVGYEPLLATGRVVGVGCMAHARRKFIEVTQTTKQEGLAHFAVAHMAKLYAIEKEAKTKHLTPLQTQALRQKKAKPLLHSLKIWLDDNSLKTPPKSPIAKAIGYTLNQWQQLIRYLEDGRLEIDNNRTERGIKPFVTGRKNWLFMGNESAAKASANLFSLIETAKTHHINVYAYLRYLFTLLPTCTTPDELEQLLPYHCKDKILSISS